MTTSVAVMNASNETNPSTEDKISSPVKEAAPEEANPAASPASGDKDTSPSKSETKDQSEKKLEHAASPSPPAYAAANLQGYPVTTGTPQGGAYYQGYQQSQLQVTPEPPSPVPGPNNTVTYDMGSFFQQHGAFAAPSPFTPNNALSPPRGNAAMGVIPPASPLFPRPNPNVAAALQPEGLEGARGQAPPSPNLPYMSPQLGGSSMYNTSQYPPVNQVNSQSSNSPEEANAWGDSHQQGMYQQNSSQLNAYGVPLSRAAAGARAYSFESEMLPPSALEQDQHANPAYSPYGGSQGSAGGTLFAHQPWGYGGPPDMYNSPGSPLQPRPTAMGAMPYQRGPYGQYYPASSPGPPIQTTASNKGPDGANLFIFHIPNHFTNLDMYQLFCPYGNLLSVRIMVEKDTGRSRGFGFVSYDSPESAALAIKELNGFAIGNKRLKVQHKQIRQKDLHDRDNSQSYDGGYQQRQQFPSSSLPPSGPMATQGQNNAWWGEDRKTASSNAADVSEKPDEVTDRTSTSTGGETPIGLSTESAAETISPLASMGTLQHALPEVKGAE